MSYHINYPFDANHLLRKKRSIRREFLSHSDFIEKRIAILGGSTTTEVKDMLELFLLNDGIKPVFYESEYNRYREDILFSNSKLKEFSPDIIYIHTSVVNINKFPNLNDDKESINGLIENEIGQFIALWDRINFEYSCDIIQNNFELPHYRVLGNLDCSDIHGYSSFITQLNLRFSEESRKRQNLHLNDINYLAAWFGLERWYDKLFWYSYKYAMSLEAIPFLANSISSIIKSIFGKNKKCLVLDLDNTLWGGIIGDDGVNGIRIGNETAVSEAYTEFQQYIKKLKERGVILAVSSKNDDKIAREGFTHPDSILELNDFSEFRANWELKHENIRHISQQLNIGIDSIVFVDDNPFERDIVRSQEPQVAVIELGNNVAKYIDIIDKTGFFESVLVSSDDLKRSEFYADNAVREEVRGQFENYEDFLRSLNMIAEIRPFIPVYLDRITQLTNKTNQFNLTTRRYTFAEIEALAKDNSYIKLYGRLSDKFGDNGIVSIIVGAIQQQDLHINLWLMSCRVLKRGMEGAMLDELAAKASEKGVKTLIGYYYPTSKNGMVKELFKEMGFKITASKDDGSSIWSLDIGNGYSNKNQIIQIDNDN